ncbi:hypothetical protein BDZ97DRAFT_92630 [Flammula alnicola]|nr:hypothetical protein BDZ97DRAFT_92630 [Flammula alnicola]
MYVQSEIPSGSVSLAVGTYSESKKLPPDRSYIALCAVGLPLLNSRTFSGRLKLVSTAMVISQVLRKGWLKIEHPQHLSSSRLLILSSHCCKTLDMYISLLTQYHKCQILVSLVRWQSSPMDRNWSFSPEDLPKKFLSASDLADCHYLPCTSLYAPICIAWDP